SDLLGKLASVVTHRNITVLVVAHRQVRAPPVAHEARLVEPALHRHRQLAAVTEILEFRAVKGTAEHAYGIGCFLPGFKVNRQEDGPVVQIEALHTAGPGSFKLRIV